jgi:hypothetical protein
MLAVVTAALALPFAGCTFPAPQASDSHSQKDVIGPVEAVTTICPDTAGSTVAVLRRKLARSPRVALGCDTSTAERGQLLVAYLVPDGTDVPATLTSSSGTTVTFARDDVYATQVGTQMGATTGSHWVGFRSSEYDVPAGTDPSTIVPADLGLPPGPSSDADPYAGPFTYQTAVGQRFVDDVALDPNRDVACQDSPLVPAFGAETICYAQVLGPFDVETRDLRAGAPADPVAIQQGETGTVPFALKFAGAADPLATFALTTTSTLTGATVTPDQPAFAPPADSTSTRNVSVAVPKDAAPGPYDVTLTATVGGQTRSAVAHIAVTEAPAPPPPPVQPAPVIEPPGPALAETLRSLRHADYKKSTLAATFGCNTACDATLDLLVYEPPAKRAGIARRYKEVPTVLIGRLNASLGVKGSKRAAIKLFPQAVEGLRHLDSYTLIVRTTAVGRSGNRTEALVRKLRIRHGCKPGVKPCVKH